MSGFRGIRLGATRACAIGFVVAVTAVGVASVGAAAPGASKAPSPAKGSKAAKHPNIVFVLTDDLAWNLVKYMPHVQEMRNHGETFTRYFVTDSLCCPSRASIFTGRLPHNTGVFTNNPSDGGFSVFHDRGNEHNTFATAISKIPGAHYQTGMMGKYLNGYKPAGLFVPPGWSEWDVAGNGYGEFDYQLNQNGRLVSYGHKPKDYLTDVLADKGVRFIRHSSREGDPFMLEIATFAPHAPFTPAPRDRNDFPGLAVPRTPAFNAANLNPPTWLAGHDSLSPTEISKLNRKFRLRAPSIQAVGYLIGWIQRTLRNRGLAKDTYIVFSSDNGYHMGDHRLLQGKMTAFDTDIRVPLIVVGPGVPAGRTVGKLAENIDLRPTFSRLAGAKVPRKRVDGHNLVPLLHAKHLHGWRTATLIEHHGPDDNPSDPDFQPVASGNPTSYEAIRKPNAVYVEYRNGDREYYDLSTDPYELDNTYADLGASQQANLHQTLTQLEGCNGPGCWAAAGG
jgi:N-acetylglucosamine-6-sulfatase